MKKVLVVFIVGVVLFGGFSAQRAEAQSANIAQRIIGTWVDDSGKTWVFNANGTCVMKGNANYKFGVTDTKLAISDEDYGNNDVETEVFDISISSDGKTLILEYMSIQSRANSGIVNAIWGRTRGYWLTKK